MSDEFKTTDELALGLFDLKRRVEDLESRLNPLEGCRTAPGESNDELARHAIETLTGLIQKYEFLENELEKRKQLESEVNKTTQLYQWLVETAKDVIWTLDLELRLTFVSPSVTAALGYSVEEMMAMDTGSLLTDESRERIMKAYREELALEAAGPRERYASRTEEMERYRKDGATSWAEITTTFLRDSEGRPVGILGISRDITERKRMEQELLKAHNELEKRVQERTAALEALNAKLLLEIEERKRAEKSLRESEHMLRSILATSPVGIGLSCDREMKWCNEAWIKMFGFEDEVECLNRSALMVYPSENEFERVGRILYDGLETGKVTEAEAEFQRKDGPTFHGHIRMKALHPSDPSLGTIAAILDMTDAKKAQDALKVSEAQYKYLYSMMRLMCDNVPDLIWVKDLGGRYLFCNRTICERLLNASNTDEPLGKNHMFFAERERSAHPDDPHWHTFGEVCVNSDQEVMRTQRPARFCEFGNVKGQFLYLDVYKAPFRNEHGEMIGIVGCARDVTLERRFQEQRKLAEDALRESEERYRLLVHLSPDGIGVHIGDRFVFANKSAAKLLGAVGPEQLINRPITEFVHHGCVENFVTWLRDLPADQSHTLIEARFVRVDDKVIDVEVAAVPVSFQSKEAVQIVFRDISGRKRGQEEQRKLATAVEQAADAVAIADHLGNIQYVNPGFELMTGYTRDEVTGKTLGLLKSREQDETSCGSMWDSIMKGEAWQGRVVGQKKDGGPLHAILTISPVRDADGEIQNYVGVGHDITQQMLLERQLLQAQKMEAVGTLAGGIAHDFNNLLQVTLGFSELLLAKKKEDDPDNADLLKILQAAKNGAELVQRLLMYSRKVEPKPIPLDLNKQIVQVEKLLRRTIPKMIDIQMDLANDLTEINADPTQMQQVLMNLAVNARDAMPHGGKLTLETKNFTLDDEYCRLHMGSKPGKYVLLTVSDTGHGMDQATVEHIFEPFYTTKEPGRGTGLGLATVYGIVKQHDGYITCQSEVGRGTIFHAYFPVIREGVEPLMQYRPEITSVFGTETILLVDDDEVVRTLGQRILIQAGYTVLTARNGIEGLGLFKEKRDQIALVILDLVMPQLGGKECLGELVKIDPRVKILVASGYSVDAATRESVDLGARDFISKPFRYDELLQKVRRVLDEG